MNFVWYRRGITPESLSCQSCVAWQSLSKLIAELNLIKKFDSDDVLLLNLIPKLSLAWQKRSVNWASLLPGWCQRGFDWGDGWIQAKLGCKKSLSTGWWWLHFGGASTKVSPIMFFLWETHLIKVSFQSWITCNFILIYHKFTSLTVPFGLEDLISVLKSILQDESPVAIRQACVSLKV